MVKKGKRKIHVRLIKHLRETHRQLGIALAFFTIFLAVTGMLINHGHSLKFDHTKVEASWLLDHYNIEAPDNIQKFLLGQNAEPLFAVGDQVWLSQQLLFTSETAIKSAGLWQQFIVIASAGSLHIYQENGELVDVLEQLAGVPSAIQQLAIVNDDVYLQSHNGLYVSRDQLESFQPIAIAPVEQISPSAWLKPVTVSKPEQAQYQHYYRSQILNWERVLLDIHSGRFFSGMGVLFMDLVAIFLIILSLSGVYMWVRQARARH